MATYLLKFSACLFMFWLVYVLVLERQKMHVFKRFYLFGAFFVSMIIPVMTITHYVEPIIQNFEVTQNYLSFEPVILDIPVETETPFNWEALLWSIYGIGVLLFLVRFIYNLVQLYQRITKHEIFKKQPFIYVLLKEYRIPHSFFKFIFLNKSKFENNAIPTEVILHEETHAKQWHSLDILLVELLQIVFWFHPLVYVLKHHIKLNHEFLADQAVLNYGADAKTYQNLLLQFSSGTQHQLSSAINYSSIKKRFKVMKTQTSKTRIWLSILLLLPIIAILFYSFAEREYIEKDNADVMVSINKESQKTPIDTQIKSYKEVTAIYSNAISKYLKGSQTNNSELKILKAHADKIYNQFSKEELEEHNIFPTPPVPAKINSSIIQKPVMWILVNRKGQMLVDDEIATLKEIDTKLKKLSKTKKSGNIVYVKYDPEAPKKLLAELKVLVKKHRFKFDTLDVSQIPPPPPPPPAPPKVKYKGGNKTNSINQSNKVLPVEIDVDKDYNLVLNGNNILVENLIEEVSAVNSHLTKEQHRKYVFVSIIVPDNSFMDFSNELTAMLRKANVYQSGTVYSSNLEKTGRKPKHTNLYNGLTISEAEAKRKKIFEGDYDNNVKKRIDNLNNSSNPWEISVGTASYEYIDDEGNSTGKVDLLSTDNNEASPKLFVNNKSVEKGILSLTKVELKQLKLTSSKGEVIGFKLKIPSVKTEFIKRNTITKTTLENLKSVKTGDNITLFDIRDDTNFKFSPIIIKIIN